VTRLLKVGIPAVALHAGIKGYEQREIIEGIKNEEFKLIYCSPERLQSRMFQELLPFMRISLVAVDEAHCVSQWGHDFRREYLEISFLKKRFPRIPILALTATATPVVAADIRKHLLIPNAILFQQSFARTNIFYDVQYSENKPAALLDAIKVASGSTIIYCRSRNHTEAIAHQLKAEGINCVFYHAGMKAEARVAAQLAWMKSEAQIIAATTAFGMGIDKADVRLVVHFDIPEDLESWYQESGRAGRDGLPAKALTLFNKSDIKTLNNSGTIKYPSIDYQRKVYQAVVEYLQIPIGTQPELYYPFELQDFCKKFSLKPREAAPALHLLAQEGFFTLTETVFHPPTIQFTCDRSALDVLQSRQPFLSALATALLRSYTGIFTHPVPVHLPVIIKKLKAKKEEIEKGLLLLANQGLIDWTPIVEGPQLFFNSYRVDSRDLIINTDRLAMLRERHDVRTKAMLHFLENEKECRGAAILEYFGEKHSKACGHCDVCKRQNTSTPASCDIRAMILERLQASKNPLRMRELTSQLPEIAKEVLTSTLREMVEAGRILWHPDNSFSIPIKKGRGS
ncbi:MAG: RecQ family ATP-dependent DNA helicase, partial [Chitinophagaceae bacterium]